MSRQLDITVTRGTTLKSGEIFSVEEPLPAGITYAALLEGIDAGDFTLKSLASMDYTGQIRDRANATWRAELVFSKTGDKLSFSVPANTTAQWPNESAVYKYDVIGTNNDTGVVSRVVWGNIIVEPSITNEDL